MGSENEDRRSTRKQSKLTSSPTLLPVHEEEVMEDISVHEEEVMEEIFPELDGEVTDTSASDNHEPVATPPRSPSIFATSSSDSEEEQYPTGLDAEELNALFKLPPRPKNDPRDLASLKTEGIAKSFMWLGIKPKLGLPYDLVHGMEQQQAKDAKKLEERNDMYDELDEGEQQAKATEEDDETIEARPGKRQKKAMEDDDEAGTKATEDDDESDEARPAKRQTNTFTNSPIKEDIEAAATMLTLRQPVVFANSNQDPGNYNERTDARARAVSTLSAADSQATVSAAETISREPTPTPPARRINTAGATA
ncbi:hypothetical protein A1F96_09365 [Pyrenophora tritici-repentis]|uniref:SNF2-family ATP dependent chromatin remodeling factor snf21 n=2 Tax=Pyrenophora tritici-repentis TaxID=45151 RepID=A0A2W1FXF8_9PLEO|nr:SNF2-family ATP dependent chromatin remodeling factor snf21 [Pyrenophora tritici-repentis]KAI0576028.1 hypothetical protein Alg215_07689 [Pyrenophora tritici-repentis]PZD24414.1 hypothetical protein A1F96_09365 [Pyrenophora tritici-repentis]